MYRKIILLLLLSGYANAHQFLPTYPKMLSSLRDGVYEVHMELYNSRKDITYYQLEVFDDNWNNIPFATFQRIVKVPYLDRRNLTVYIRKQDKFKATYICTKSKILQGNEQASVVSSRICSKFKV